MLKGGRVLALILLLVIGGSPVRGEALVAPELQGALQSATDEDVFSVIVTFDTEETIATLAHEAGSRGRGEVVRTLRSRAERTQGAVRDFLRGRGARFRDLWIINALALDASPGLIAQLAERPEVAEIRPDGVLQLSDPQLAQAHDGFWNLEAIGAPELWAQGIDGSGATVAVLDSGVDVDHPDLAPRWRGGLNSWFNPYAAGCTAGNCTPCEASAGRPCDDPSGHGTAVAGIIVGGDAGGTPIGVAPGAQWIAAKVFRDDGTATFAAIHSALQWALDPDGNPNTDDAPHVVNNSWGLSSTNACNQEFRADVQALQAAGIAVVFAAGNNGPGAATSISPGNYPEGIAAGAVSGTLQLPPFSGRGPSACDGAPYPEVAAPGVEIRTAGVGAVPYVLASGTSFSAPHLSGTVALLRQALPGVSPRELVRASIDSAADLGPIGRDNGFGAGLLDAVAALRRAQGLPHLGVYDFFPPASDRRFTFGAIAPGQALRQEFFLYNAGGGALRIESTVLAGAAPQAFTVAENRCVGIDILPGERCLIALDFVPPSAAIFEAELAVQSNSLQGALSILLNGEGADVPPAFNVIPSRVSFGSVPPGSSALREITVANDGQGILALAPIAPPPSPFAIAASTCLPSLEIPAGQECTITLRFAPETFGVFSGALQLQSQNGLQTATVTLEGTGNTPPPAAQLLSPAAGAVVPTNVTFVWRTPVDPDGQPVSDILVVSRSIEFPDNLASRGADGGADILLAGAGGLLFALGGICLVRRRHRSIGALLIALALIAMAACGGGDGDNGVAGRESSQVVSGLVPGTTYFWKVVSEDALGGVASSEIRTFLVQ